MWTNSYTLKQLGEFIADARRAQGYTQMQFAELLKVSHATVSALEQGRSVSSKTLQAALQWLGMRMVIVPKSAIVKVTETDQL